MERAPSQLKELQCPTCQKSFAHVKKRQAGKHFSYCRRKRVSSPVIRRKSCDECVRAKARCSCESAGCSRCIEKGTICTYSGRSSNNSDLCSPSAPGGELLQDSSPGVILDATDPIWSLDQPGHDEAPLVDTENWASTSTLRWDNETFELCFPDTPDLLAHLGDDFDLRVEGQAASSSGKTPGPSDSIPSTRYSQGSRTSIPASLPYYAPSTMFERREFSKPELQLTGDFALYTLRSYLNMIADQDSVPPFIHPKYRNWMEVGTNRPSPLYAAMRLTKMLYLGRGMNKTLIWRLIRIEQERLLNDYSKFGKWEILEALQSLIIYILLRITEGRHDYTNFDTQLLISLYVVCRHIATTFDIDASSGGLESEIVLWKDWIFLESRRRCAIVFLIMDETLHARVSDPNPEMSEFTFAPAPSPGTLWSAESEDDWAVCRAGYLHADSVHGVLRNRDLIALKESVGDHRDRWYASADSFGLLVTMVADLIF